MSWESLGACHQIAHVNLTCGCGLLGCCIYSSGKEVLPSTFKEELIISELVIDVIAWQVDCIYAEHIPGT